MEDGQCSRETQPLQVPSVAVGVKGTEDCPGEDGEAFRLSPVKKGPRRVCPTLSGNRFSSYYMKGISGTIMEDFKQ